MCIRQTNESRRHNKHQAMKLEGNVLVCTRTLTRRLAVSLVYYTEVTETYDLFCMIPNYQLTANPWAMTLKEITAIKLQQKTKVHTSSKRLVMLTETLNETKRNSLGCQSSS